jgi:putative ABC transport system substrate-binding protein
MMAIDPSWEGGDIDPMRRRDVLILLAGAGLARPAAARAQAAAMPTIGFLHWTTRQPFSRPLSAFHQGLNDMGYSEGRNVLIEYRWAESREDRLQALAADLVGRQVSLIVATGGTFVGLAAKAATSKIPIVFLVGSDPVQLGLVSSFNRPGGNATGWTLDSTEMLAKRLEMLRELVPPETRIAMLMSSARTVEKFETDFVERHNLIGFKVGAKEEFEDQFEKAVKNGAGALLVSADSFYTGSRAVIVALAEKHRLPAVYPWRLYAEAGGLASYGPDIIEAYKEVGRYAGRILKGTRPEDLPVQLPTKFELVINRKSATALGLTLPRLIHGRADHVID